MIDEQAGCQILETPSGFNYYWLETEAQITISQISTNGHNRALTAELTVERPVGKVIFTNANINLLSRNARVNLAIDLGKTYQDKYLPWLDYIEYAAHRTIEYHRKPPELENIDAHPEKRKIEYMLEPILALGQPTTIFSPGGKGKSIFADYIAVLITHGVVSLGNLPFYGYTANVLYLDWEGDSDNHKKYITAIEKGLGITEHATINYLNCNQSLNHIVGSIKQMVQDLEIGLVIFDSQMAATAEYPPGMTEAQVASAYYNDIRALGTTTLTIDHVTKQGMLNTDSATTPYGSVVKYNRSRSQYELRQTQDIDADYIELALVHKKFNLGKLNKPIGIRIDFINSDIGELTQIDFKSCHIEDNPELSKLLTIKQRARMLLEDEGKMQIDEMVDRLEVGKSTLESTMYREKETFVKIGKGEWGLMSDKIF